MSDAEQISRLEIVNIDLDAQVKRLERDNAALREALHNARQRVIDCYYGSAIMTIDAALKTPPSQDS